MDYLALHDQNNALGIRRKLLGQSKLQKSDFYNFYYNVLYKPFINGKDYKLYKADPSLTTEYVSRCENDLIKNDKDVCMYGHAGLLFIL
ncbi:MAG: hypothetical protein GXP45_02745 [bacterium]|nr:hypothetical protein [bacterium]